MVKLIMYLVELKYNCFFMFWFCYGAQVNVVDMHVPGTYIQYSAIKYFFSLGLKKSPKSWYKHYQQNTVFYADVESLVFLFTCIYVYFNTFQYIYMYFESLN